MQSDPGKIQLNGRGLVPMALLNAEFNFSRLNSGGRSLIIAYNAVKSWTEITPEESGTGTQLIFSRTFCRAGLRINKKRDPYGFFLVGPVAGLRFESRDPVVVHPRPGRRGRGACRPPPRAPATPPRPRTPEGLPDHRPCGLTWGAPRVRRLKADDTFRRPVTCGNRPPGGKRILRRNARNGHMTGVPVAVTVTSRAPLG